MLNLNEYTPHNWFWIVGGDENKAWSSVASSYVQSWDASKTTRIPTEQDLTDVLRNHGLRGPVLMPGDVDVERDRRMGTFTFGGKAYDLKGQSLANVSGAGTLSLAAIINGAQPGDLRWADPEHDFTWIANDNTMTAMDAQTCWAFAQTAASHRKAMIFKARAIKDMNPIPSDYTADSYWE